MNPAALELFVSTLVTLFVVIDPPGCVPIFASLTGGTPVAHQRAMAIRAVAVAGAVLVGFALVGEAFLGALGVSLDAFRVAGGLMLFFIAVDMVFEFRTKRRETRAEDVKATAAAAGKPMEYEDVSVFPMGIPMIAGPGSIASVMLLTAKSSGAVETAVVFGALAAVLLLTLFSLVAAAPLLRLLGDKVESMITRLLGVVLAALAVQFVFDGVRGAFD